jgi:hypothetical protein
MNRLYSKVVLGLVLSYLPVAAASKPDFTGTWELDIKRSDFGKAAKPARMTIQSTMEGEMMRSVQTTYVQQDTQTVEYTWYVDGKQHATDKPVPGYSITRWDDTTLVSDRQSNDGEYRETIRMSLSADGKIATETVQTVTPSGSNKERLIWHRANR